MATEAPVILVVTWEPAESTGVPVGGSYRTHLSILDADSKQPVDPDSTWPRLTVTPPWASATVYQYGGGTVLRDGLGLYHADIPVATAGKNVHQWLVTMGGVSVGSNTTEIYSYGAGYW